jgi:hypothetical protein
MKSSVRGEVGKEKAAGLGQGLGADLDQVAHHELPAVVRFEEPPKRIEVVRRRRGVPARFSRKRSTSSGVRVPRQPSYQAREAASRSAAPSQIHNPLIGDGPVLAQGWTEPRARSTNSRVACSSSTTLWIRIGTSTPRRQAERSFMASSQRRRFARPSMGTPDHR